jgi:inhibitor of KinA
VKISPLGDSALLIDFADETPDTAVLLKRALSVADAIEQAKIPGVIEVTSAYQSVAVFLEATKLSTLEAIEQISPVLDSDFTSRPRQSRVIEIPVCYDADFALDAERISDKTELSFEEIIALHSGTKFTVVCIGFMPGFPYFAGLPAQLHVPRHATPRTKVPVGSVAIANAQAGIYPVESPGGWNVIGRTPLRLFDPKQEPPALLVAGDRVCCRSISRDEFERASISNEP